MTAAKTITLPAFEDTVESMWRSVDEIPTLLVVNQRYIRVAGELGAGVVLGQVVNWIGQDARQHLLEERDGKLWLLRTNGEFSEALGIESEEVDLHLAKLEKLGLIDLMVDYFDSEKSGFFNCISVDFEAISTADRP